MCNLLLLDEVGYRYQLYPSISNYWCCWVHLCLYWFSACWIYAFLIEGMLKSLIIVVDLSISSCNRPSVLPHIVWYGFVVLVSIEYALRIVTFSRYYYYLIPLFIDDNILAVKFVLSEINIATPTFFFFIYLFMIFTYFGCTGSLLLPLGIPLVAVSEGYCLFVVRGFLIVVASLVVESKLSSCGPRT